MLYDDIAQAKINLNSPGAEVDNFTVLSSDNDTAVCCSPMATTVPVNPVPPEIQYQAPDSAVECGHPVLRRQRQQRTSARTGFQSRQHQLRSGQLDHIENSRLPSLDDNVDEGAKVLTTRASPHWSRTLSVQIHAITGRTVPRSVIT